MLQDWQTVLADSVQAVHDFQNETCLTQQTSTASLALSLTNFTVTLKFQQTAHHYRALETKSQ